MIKDGKCDSDCLTCDFEQYVKCCHNEDEDVDEGEYLPIEVYAAIH